MRVLFQNCSIKMFRSIACEDVANYEKILKIGQGTYGEVFKGRHRQTNKMVALKKIQMINEKDGFPLTAVREIRILKRLKHENIINLIEICRTRPGKETRAQASFYLVFDFSEHDLAGLLSNPTVQFGLGEIKKVMKQLFNGLNFIHAHKVLHRDLKTANILITKNGILKLADFGLARVYSPKKVNVLTNRVVTLWYRPPELLLGARDYGPSVDIWGAGCVMAELFTRVPLIRGRSEQHQLTMISHICGSITPDVWPGVQELALYKTLELPKNMKRRLKEELGDTMDNTAFDLIDKLLTLNPLQRSSASELLNHDFFWTSPLPTSLEKMLAQHSQSMFEYFTPRSKGEGWLVASKSPPVSSAGNPHYIF